MCGRAYKHKQHLNRHLRYECGKEAQFACPHCPYKSRQKEPLKVHCTAKFSKLMRLLILGAFHTYSCKVCMKTYRRKDHLVRHVKYECKDTEPLFSCSWCSFRSRRKDNLRSHMARIHWVKNSGS
ncbi:vascular endothelial zinc finger 1-like [Homalodisca vitripennis]|uniref:vascular endothelial zinc finger 1-like n=1 Tax=Homalodisca vitripennis TaxID=197043 RepID=UPI001EEAD202|nr:vascular endothelial zinc finger 1-like [Homalodisca vitripennis]KAG8259327.1 hypothetical protein J6590_014796 [Homalodisca vitripennis]